MNKIEPNLMSHIKTMEVYTFFGVDLKTITNKILSYMDKVIKVVLNIIQKDIQVMSIVIFCKMLKRIHLIICFMNRLMTQIPKKFISFLLIN